jgi:hypothetical protein
MMPDCSKYKIIFLLLILLISLRPVFSQMSGIFTIGGSNPDFGNFADAIDSLGYGVSGNVIFDVRPGIYSGFTINTIPNIGLSDTVTFQAENKDSSSVQILGSIFLNSASNLTFRSLTIRPENGQITTCLTLNKPDKIWFTNCRIEKTDNVNFNPNDALLSIAFDWIGSTKSVKFSKSVISAAKYTIRINGKYGRADFEYDSIYGTIRDDYGYPVKNFLYNTMYFTDGYMDTQNQYFEGNQVYLSNEWSWVDMTGNFKKNEFYCPVHIEGTIIYENIFHENVGFYYSNMKMVDNIVEKESIIAFCHNSLIMCNKFLGYSQFCSDAPRVFSNFFYDDAQFATAPDYQIKNNSFAVNSTLLLSVASAYINNNVLSNFYKDDFSVILQMTNNNFNPLSLGLVNVYGDNTMFYDPMFLSVADLHATNPILTRKGLNYPGNTYDIDSVIRNEFPSIGANEICLNFSLDQTEQRCNDSICLDVCMDDFTGYYWSPSWLFTDSTSNAPVIHLNSSAFVYLNNTNSGVVDSLFIEVIPSPPLANQSYSADMFTVQYSNLSWCADSVRWEFGDNTSSIEWEPLHTFPGSGVFHSKIIAYNQSGTDTCKFDTQILIVSTGKYELESIKIYPNPATTEAYVEILQPIGEYYLTIYNELGSVVYSYSGESNLLHIDLQNYIPGIYLYRIQSGKSSVVKKIIIK